MLLVRELSETAQSFQTASIISCLVTSRPGFRRRNSKTRNAFGSSGSSLAGGDQSKFPLSHFDAGESENT